MTHKPNKLGPESEEFNKLKGKRIKIWTNNESQTYWTGKLVWVDYYTLGIILDEPRRDGQTSIFYKSAIAMLEPVKEIPDSDGIQQRDNSNGNVQSGVTT